MLKEFKEFAMKGNMVDMAIGIVIGAAFGAVVSSLVNDLLMPVLAAVIGTPDFTNLFVVLKSPAGEVDMSSVDAIREAGGVVLTWGNFLTALVNFLLVAWALFFVVKGINRLKRKEEEAAPAAPAAPPADIQLLTEIRDLLKK